MMVVFQGKFLAGRRYEHHDGLMCSEKGDRKLQHARAYLKSKKKQGIRKKIRFMPWQWTGGHLAEGLQLLGGRRIIVGQRKKIRGPEGLLLVALGGGWAA